MIHEKIPVHVQDSKYTGYLHTYFPENSQEMDPDRRRPVILICPGGGYAMTSDREAEPVALQFLSMGYHAAVLRYSTAPAEYPEALLQLGRSVAWLRENADRYAIDPERVVVLGFSAGGHLAASLGVFWNKGFLADRLGVRAESLRPAGLMLCYPVITSGEKAHRGSFECLLGSRAEELREEVSLEKQVSEDTPRTFLWHTASDDCVPVENSLLFFQALLEKGVPAEMHIYPAGGHGLSLATEETSIRGGYGIQRECQSWLELAKVWLSLI